MELHVEQEKIFTITQVKCGNNVSGGYTDQTRNDPTLISVSAKHAYKYQPCTDQLSDLVEDTTFLWELCYRALWLDRRRFSHKMWWCWTHKNLGQMWKQCLWRLYWWELDMILISTMDSNLQSGRREDISTLATLLSRSFALNRRRFSQSHRSTVATMSLADTLTKLEMIQLWSVYPPKTLININLAHQLSERVEDTTFRWQLCYRASRLGRRRYSHKGRWC